MQPETRKDLVLRNTTEVVTEDELDTVLEKDAPRCYIGYETSGPVHLGHWASIRKLKDLQDAGFDVVVLFADLHTYLNKKGAEDWIRSMTRYWEATFNALGLEAEYVRGRSFQESTEYFHDLLDLSTAATINRGTRSMAEVASGSEGAQAVSQLVYPLMQALDIVHLDIDLAVGATDQRKIHMLARDTLPKIGYDKPTCLHHPLVLSLTGGTKMSSSDPETMFPLHADPETIKTRVEDAYCPAGQVEENPVLQVCQFHVFGAGDRLVVERPEKYGGDVTYERFDALQQDFAAEDLHPADVKTAVAEHVVEQLAPVRQRFTENPKLLEPLQMIGHDAPAYV